MASNIIIIQSISQLKKQHLFVFSYQMTCLKNESQSHALRARAAILRCLENGGNDRS